eukprot:COSAG05_NODE_117_length_17936_cov_137.220945_6_plen_264_part_00
MSTIKKNIFRACTCLLSLHTILNCKHVGPSLEPTRRWETWNIDYPSPFHFFFPFNDQIVQIFDQICAARAPLCVQRAVQITQPRAVYTNELVQASARNAFALLYIFQPHEKICQSTLAFSCLHILFLSHSGVFNERFAALQLFPTCKKWFEEFQIISTCPLLGGRPAHYGALIPAKHGRSGHARQMSEVRTSQNAPRSLRSRATSRSREAFAHPRQYMYTQNEALLASYPTRPTAPSASTCEGSTGPHCCWPGCQTGGLRAVT